MRALVLTVLLLSVVCDQEETQEIQKEHKEEEGHHQERSRADEESHYEAFVQSFTSILVSEIGDKTFFLAAIMAMRYNKMAIFGGAGSALVFMTLISCAFGMVLPRLLPKIYTQFAAMFLFFFFGIKLLWDWKYGEEGGAAEEKQEVEVELQNLHKKLISSASNKLGDIEQPQEQNSTTRRQPSIIPLSTIVWQAFILTFLNEWGDRSQISTIALAAVHHGWIVFLGGSLGHLICTTMAVLGGDYFSDKISEKTVNLSGGVIFLIFGLYQGYSILSETRQK